MKSRNVILLTIFIALLFICAKWNQTEPLVVQEPEEVTFAENGIPTHNVKHLTDFTTEEFKAKLAKYPEADLSAKVLIKNSYKSRFVFRTLYKSDTLWSQTNIEQWIINPDGGGCNCDIITESN